VANEERGDDRVVSALSGKAIKRIVRELMIARDMVRMLRPGATGSPTSADPGAPEARRLAAGAEF
jgi:hypothetical protein